MPNVQIIIDVAGQSAGVPDEPRIFTYGVVAPTAPLVTLSIDDDTDVEEYFWQFIFKPEGAESVVLDDPVSATPTFTPVDGVTGSYVISCSVNNGEARGRNGIAFKTENYDLRKLAASEGNVFHQSVGWVWDYNDLVDKLDAISGGGGTNYWARSSGILSPITTSDTVQVAYGDATNPGYAFIGQASSGVLFDSGGSQVAIAYSGNIVATAGSSWSFDMASHIYFHDGFQGGSTYPSYNMPFSDALSDWSDFYTYYGDVSLLNALGQIGASLGLSIPEGAVVFGSPSGGIDHDIAGFYYDKADNFVGVNNQTPECGFHLGATSPEEVSASNDGFITGDFEVDGIAYVNSHIEATTLDSASLLTAPVASSHSVLVLSNMEEANDFEVLNVYNNASLGTGYGVYFDGAAGGGVTDYSSIGHRLWSLGSITIGHGLENPSLPEQRRAYTSYQYVSNPIPATGDWVMGNLAAESDLGWANFAYVKVLAAKDYDLARIDLVSSDEVSIWASGDISVDGDIIEIDATGELRFDDGNRSGWVQSYVLLSDDSDSWEDYKDEFGEVSLMAAMVALAQIIGGGGFDVNYDYGGPGAGRSATIDAGPVTFAAPVASSNSVLCLSNIEPTNTAEVMNLFNDASLSTGYTMYIDGDAGGVDSDTNELGHIIWSPGSLTMGHGDTTDGATNSRSYVNFYYWEEDTYYFSCAQLRSEGDTSWGEYAYLQVGKDIASAWARLKSTGEIYFEDGNRAGSTWPTSTMPFSGSSSDWDDLDTLIDGAGTSHTLIGGMLAAATGGGVSDLDEAYEGGNTINVDTDTPVILAKAFGVTGSALYIEDDSESADASITIDRGAGQNPAIDMINGSNAGHWVRMFDFGYLIGEHSTNGNWGLVMCTAEVTSASSVKLKASYSETSYYSSAVPEFELTETSTGSYIDIANVDYIDFNNSYCEAIHACDYGASYSNVVTSNNFDFDPDNGIEQRVSISADSTWSLATPGGCTRTTLWVKNSDTSDHTLTLTGSPTVTWFGVKTDGFTIPASSACIVTIIYDTNYDWAIAVTEEYS
jgi:hypothetical protein